MLLVDGAVLPYSNQTFQFIGVVAGIESNLDRDIYVYPGHNFIFLKKKKIPEIVILFSLYFISATTGVQFDIFFSFYIHNSLSRQ